MSQYEVHFGLELPFWLELRDGDIEIGESGTAHRFKLSNNVHRLDIGDFFVGPRPVRYWVQSEDAEHLRKEFQQENPDMPITRHASKTVLTHVRDVECENDEVVRLYHERREEWFEETLRLTNRLIEVYMHLAGGEGDVGPVASSDVEDIIVSFWQVQPNGTKTQLAGMHLLTTEEAAPQSPIEEERERLVRLALRDEVQLSLIDYLQSGASALISRGRYRHAVADAVSALEMQIAQWVEGRLKRVLPPDMVDDLVRQRFDDLCSWMVKLEGPDVKQAQDWPGAVRARRLRQDILHAGANASRADAEAACAATGAIINLVKRWDART